MTLPKHIREAQKASLPHIAPRAWYESNLIKTLASDMDEVQKLFDKRAHGLSYVEILQYYRILSHSEDRFTLGGTTAVRLSDWLSMAYPDEWLDAEKSWGFSMFETAKAGAMTKLRDRTVTEVLTNYDADGEVLGTQTREKVIPADTKFIQRVLEVYDPERWNRKEAMAAELDKRKLEIQDAAMKNGSATDEVADRFEQIMGILTISADSITPEKNTKIKKSIQRTKKPKDVEIIEND